jgi:hypothetical protein
MGGAWYGSGVEGDGRFGGSMCRSADEAIAEDCTWGVQERKDGNSTSQVLKIAQRGRPACSIILRSSRGRRGFPQCRRSHEPASPFANRRLFGALSARVSSPGGFLENRLLF